MTGYGKAESRFGNNKIIIEIRSVNGKGSEVNLKTQIIPREKEIEVKQIVAQALQRGTIDLFSSIEYAQESLARAINKDVFLSYYRQISELQNELGLENDSKELIQTILRLPDVIDNQKREIDEEFWETFKVCLLDALNSIAIFRTVEGEKLEEDLRKRVELIMTILKEIEGFENERVTNLKQRLDSRLQEVSQSFDQNRFEQEIIYYLEKLDITEEKVRLKQHCNYFLETIDNEQYPGKKINFIAQEMGREINTLGSKANHAGIQKCVVRMKDELEKIKEQSLNIL
jgi:uncharacterized protein (TIGR00255 family)